MSSDAELPERIAGDLALDLVNTLSWRGTRREFDHLVDSQAILAWSRAAGLIDAKYVLPGAAQDAFVQEVHRLRQAIADVGTAIASGAEPPAAALEIISGGAARSLASSSLSGAPATLKFSVEHSITGALAWAALDLFRGGELARLKQCPPADCRWLFIDRTKNGSRKWCDMATCGNRAKARRRS